MPIERDIHLREGKEQINYRERHVLLHIPHINYDGGCKYDHHKRLLYSCSSLSNDVVYILSWSGQCRATKDVIREEVF